MLKQIAHLSKTALAFGVSLVILLVLVILLPRLVPGEKIPAGSPATQTVASVPATQTLIPTSAPSTPDPCFNRFFPA